MMKLAGSDIIRWAAMVSRSGEPGPAPTRVMRPPLLGWILGGLLLEMFDLLLSCPENDNDDCSCSSCWSNLSFW